MITKHARSHLVAGALPDKLGVRTADFQGDRQRLTLMTRAAKALAPHCDYAVSINRDHGTQVFLALADAAEADRIAAVFNSQAVVPYEGWASQRSFTLDDNAMEVLMGIDPEADFREPG